MDDYLLYEPIGEGDATVVYKGRRLGTLEYVAIQRLEMHCEWRARAALEHSEQVARQRPRGDEGGAGKRIVEVYKWCQTSREHWLVMDLCPGGDLMSLLANDVRVAEPMALTMIRDVAVGLLDVHAAGLLMRDLRPSQILVDDGCLLLGTLESCTNLLAAPTADGDERGGTPRTSVLYMAPELLSPNISDDDHLPFTLASDLWALGSILYELLTGFPPFVSESAPITVQMTLEDPLPLEPLAGVSEACVDLLCGLLDKDVALRFTWEDVVNHGAWGDAPIPYRPTSDAKHQFRTTFPHARTRRLSRTATPVSAAQRARTPRSHLGPTEARQSTSSGGSTVRGSAGNFTVDSLATALAHGVNLAASSDLPSPQGTSTPVRGSYADFPPRPQTASGDQPAEPLRLTQSLDHASLPNTPHIESATRPVSDTLDHSDHDSESAQPQAAPSPRPLQPSRLPRRTTKGSLLGDDLVGAVHHIPRKALEAMGEGTMSSPARYQARDNAPIDKQKERKRLRQQQATRSSVVKLGAAAKTHQQPEEEVGQPDPKPQRAPRRERVSSAGKRTASASPSSSPRPARRRSPRVTRKATQAVLDRAGALAGVGGGGKLSRATGGQAKPEDLLIHDADLAVTPLVGNPKIAKGVKMKYDGKALGFAAVPAHAWADLDAGEADAHVQSIHTALAMDGSSRAASRTGAGSRGSERATSAGGGGGVGSGSSAVRARRHVLGYLHVLCGTPDVANMVANSQLFPGLGRMLKAVSDDLSRIRVARVLGLVARNATLIEESVPMGEVLLAIAEAARDNFRNADLKTQLFASLGETLFYVASQSLVSEHAPDSWRVPSLVFSMLARGLRKEEPELVQHYCCKTIENVASVPGHSSAQLATHDNGRLLWGMLAKSKHSGIRRSCAVALFRLGHSKPDLLQHVVDKAGVAQYIGTLKDPVARVRQAVVNTMLSVFCPGHELPRLHTALLESERLVALLVQSLETSPPVLRAKCYALLACICRHNTGGLMVAVKERLLAFLDRDDRAPPAEEGLEAQDEYLARAGSLLLGVLVEAGRQVTARLAAILEEVAGRNHPSPSQTRSLKPVLQAFPFVLHSVTSPLLRARLLCGSFITDLGAAVRLLRDVVAGNTNLDAVAAGAGRELVRNVMAVAESLSQSAGDVLAHGSTILQHALPHLLALAAITDELDDDGDAVRYLSLRIVADLVHRLLAAAPTAPLLASPFTARLIPACAALLKSDRDSIPTLAAKILNLLLDADGEGQGGGGAPILPSLVEAGVPAASIVAFQRGAETAEARKQNGPVVDSAPVTSLVHRIVAAKSVGLGQLVQWGCVGKTATALQSVALSLGDAASTTELLAIAFHLLRACATNVQAALQDGAGRSAAEQRQAMDLAEWSVVALRPMVGCVDSLVLLTGDPADEVALQAARCLALLLQLEGKEAFSELLSAANLEALAGALVRGGPGVQRILLKMLKRALGEARSTVAGRLAGTPSIAEALLSVRQQLQQAGGDPDLTALATDLCAVCSGDSFA